MKIFRLIESHFGLFMTASIAAGLIFPRYSLALRGFLEPALMALLFLVFLKLDVVQVLKNFKQVGLMAYIVAMFMFVVPIIVFLFANIFDSDIALALLLLTAVPAGTSSPAFTELLNGNSTLSLSVTILTTLIAPFSIPLLFTLLSNENVALDQWKVLQTLVLLIFVPMILSLGIKKYFVSAVEKTKWTFSAINVLIVSIFIIYPVIGQQRGVILGDGKMAFYYLFILYAFSLCLHLVGYLMAFGRPKKDKIAFVVGKAYMNNGLAIVLAAKFFSPVVILIVVLSEFPWATLLAPFKKIMEIKK